MRFGSQAELLHFVRNYEVDTKTTSNFSFCEFEAKLKSLGLYISELDIKYTHWALEVRHYHDVIYRIDFKWRSSNER